MKKTFLTFLILLVSVYGYCAPTNRMSITVPEDGDTISATDEATRYNEITTKFNVHDHTAASSSSSNTFTIGDGAPGNKTYAIDDDQGASPSLRYNTTDDEWTVSNDGATYSTYDMTLTPVQLTGTQTITGNKTFSGTTTFSNGVILPSGAVFFMLTGDCPTGTTDVTTTYSDKFIRINATQGTTGGSDTHTHAAGSYKGPNHIHTVPRAWADSAETPVVGELVIQHHAVNPITNSGRPPATITTSASGTGSVTGTSASGDNVPAYVQCKICQVD